MIRPIVVNSIPKAGTHLVSRALSLVPGIDGEYTRLEPRSFAPADGEATVQIGIGLPRPASMQRVRAALQALQRGQFALWHVPYSEPFHALLRELNLAMMLMVRDPRDVAVSHGMHIAQFRGHRLHSVFQAMSEDERLTAVIDGLRDAKTGTVQLESLATRYENLLRWQAHDDVHVVRFEDLVGERGGGTAEAQRSALRDMLGFIGVRANEQEIERIAGRMFGETVTFRRGQVGGWREVLSGEQAAHIEAACGSMMQRLGYASSSAGSSAGGCAGVPHSTVEPFIVNSFPKSGTKLLCKVCAMLPGVSAMPTSPRWRALSMMPSAWLRAPAEGTAGAKPIAPTTRVEASALLASIPRGRFVEHHVAYSPELASLMAERDVRMLMMVRDPRDAVVSLADYLAKAAHHPLHAFFAALSAEERLVRAIVGVRADESGGVELSDVGTRYRRRIGWIGAPGVQVVRFEDLVGPAGGGDEVRQRRAIRQVLTHLSINAVPALLNALASSSFGGTRTFHHGRIGRWRDVFSPEVRTLFAGLAGDMLEALGYDAEPK